ncbi:MAG TPA: beta-ketoacyl-[acyl-carrier-protein] synthase family protein [Pirellulales bacterium]
MMRKDDREPIVITGVGMITATGADRESVWRAVQRGTSGVRKIRGLVGIPDDLLIGATVDLPASEPGRLKVLDLARTAAAEAMADARLHPMRIDRERFGCAVSGHVGDTSYVLEKMGLGDRLAPNRPNWWDQFLPNTACQEVANHYGLRGPRISHSVACASGAIDILSAVRCIEDDQADLCLAGSAEAIHPVFAAGFKQMRVLATHDDPTQACRPFDADRNGFVMGEGAAMFVLERLSHALDRGARIYAEIVAGKVLSEGRHVTALDEHAEALTRTIVGVLRRGGFAPDDVEYINVHGTGTEQNDVCEATGIRQAFGRAADRIPVSATKSMIGHLVNAAGSVELAVTTLALRDGFAPPTINLHSPDPRCRLDHLPLYGRRSRPQTALKLSVAFGGHLAAILLRRWNDASSGFGYPSIAVPAAA